MTRKIDNVLTPKQQEFFFAKDKRLNFLVGSVRSGKTHISLIKFALRVVANAPKGEEFLFCAKTFTTLKRNVLNPLLSLVGASNFSYNLTKKEGVLFNHRLYLEGANNETSENKIRGMTLAGAYCDEITLFPESFVSMLLSRLSRPNAKLYATCNPDNPNHYIKKEFIDDESLNRTVWQFLLTDNTFLPKEYIEDISKEYSGVFYNRYILGQWVRAEGLIYGEFANNTEAYLLPMNYDYKKNIVYMTYGIDFGGNKSATSFVCTGFTQGFRDVIILEAERHEKELTPNELDQLFYEFVERCHDKYGKMAYSYADSSEQILIRGLRNIALRFGLQTQVKNAKKSAIKDRIMAVNKLIGSGRFWVNRHCTTVIKALQDAVWDEDKEDERLDDFSSDIDTLDAMEYSIEPHFKELFMARR